MQQAGKEMLQSMKIKFRSRFYFYFIFFENEEAILIWDQVFNSMQLIWYLKKVWLMAYLDWGGKEGEWRGVE